MIDDDGAASITFAIAAYNCADMLETCVKSVVSQLDSDSDVLIVDDGSTDETGELSVRLSIAYPAVSVFRQENKGLSGARNASISNARGDYVVFMDADDTLPPGSAEAYKKALSREWPDICFGDYYICEGSGRSLAKSINGRPGAYGPDARSAFVSCCLEGLGFSSIETTRLSGAAWGKAYKRSFLLKNNLLFDLSLPRAQDIAFNIEAVLLSDSLLYIAEPVYEYYVLDGSKSHRTSTHLLEDMKAFSVRARELIQTTQNESLLNEYRLLTISEIESISVRGRYLERGSSLKEAISLVASDDIYSEAIREAKVRSLFRLKENAKIFLYKTKSYGLLSCLFAARNIRE